MEARVNLLLKWDNELRYNIFEEDTDISNHGNWRTIMLATIFRDAVGHELVSVRRDQQGDSV